MWRLERIGGAEVPAAPHFGSGLHISIQEPGAVRQNFLIRSWLSDCPPLRWGYSCSDVHSGNSEVNRGFSASEAKIPAPAGVISPCFSAPTEQRAQPPDIDSDNVGKYAFRCPLPAATLTARWGSIPLGVLGDGRRACCEVDEAVDMMSHWRIRTIHSEPGSKCRGAGLPARSGPSIAFY